MVEFIDDHPSRIAAADDHHIDGLGVIGNVHAVKQQPEQPVRKANAHHSKGLKHTADGKVRHRHPPDQRSGDQGNPGDHNMGRRGQHTGQHRPDQLITAGKLPQAAVQPHHRKQNDRHNGKRGGAAQPAVQIVHRDHGGPAVKAEPEGKQIGQIDGQNVKHDQSQCDHLTAENFFFGSFIWLHRRCHIPVLLSSVVFCNNSLYDITNRPMVQLMQDQNW